MIFRFKPSKKNNRSIRVPMIGDRSIIRGYKPIKLKFFNESKFSPKRSSAEWKLIDKNPFGDTDGDKVPNWFDCKPLDRKKQGWVHKGKDKGKFKVYSIRPYSETYTGNIHPADNTDRMSYSRDTGYFGTGIYGFDTKKTALKFKEKKHADEDGYGYGSQARGHIREFTIEKPLVLKNKSKSEALFEASKIMNRARTGDKEDQEKLWRAKYRLQEAGIDATDEEIKQAVYAKRAKWGDKEGNKDQPITMLLKQKGYGGVIPAKEYQTFEHGSVIHVSGKIEKDTTPLTKFEKRDKEIAKKLQHELYRKNKKYQGKGDFFQDEGVPSYITGEINDKEVIDYDSPKLVDSEDIEVAEMMEIYDKPTKAETENITQRMKEALKD